jgi:hypothetical protein
VGDARSSGEDPVSFGIEALSRRTRPGLRATDRRRRLFERWPDDVEPVPPCQLSHMVKVVVAWRRLGRVDDRQPFVEEHVLEAGRRDQHERSGAAVEDLVAVGHLARPEDELTRSGGEDLIAQPEADLPVEDVERLVLLVVDVQGVSIPAQKSTSSRPSAPPVVSWRPLIVNSAPCHQTDSVAIGIIARVSMDPRPPAVKLMP